MEIKLNKTLEEFIFRNLEKDDYLLELFQELLEAYCNKLFNKNNSKIGFDLNDILRFADLLSHSEGQEESEFHHNLSQGIMAMIDSLYPRNEKVKFFEKTILKTLNNYVALSKLKQSNSQNRKIEGDYLMNYILEKYQEDYLKIPGSEKLKFIDSQKEIFDKLENDFVSYSAPTSMGKSFIMRMFIKFKIKTGETQDFAFIVPTKALINETYFKIINDLKSLLKSKNYKVIRSVNEISDHDKSNHIFVMTPERMMYLLNSPIDFKLAYVFIDESQRMSKNDYRSTFYYQIIDLLQKRHDRPLISFASPNIPNPEVYLKLINKKKQNEYAKHIRFSPVNQLFFKIDYNKMKISCFNSLEKKFSEVTSFKSKHLSKAILFVEKKDKQSLVYCRSTKQAVEEAIDLANQLPVIKDTELNNLSEKISKQIHSDYYLAELVKKGVAYHVGYLPENVKSEIEEEYRRGKLKIIFCTSTLMEGINLPADNLFITSLKNGQKAMDQIDFYNLVGRTGRLEYSILGHVFLIVSNSKENVEKKYSKFLKSKISSQDLAINSVLKKKEVDLIVDSLLKGDLTLSNLFEKYPKSEYLVLRKYMLIYIQSLRNNRKGAVRKRFRLFISDDIEQRIKLVLDKNYFENKIKSFDNDINVSPDQILTLQTLIENNESFPKIYKDVGPNYNETVFFLEKLAKAFNWEQYEPKDLGKKTNGEYRMLKWYAVILIQWISGYGLSNILSKAIEYKEKNPKSSIRVNGELINYNGSRKHKNYIINDTLKVLQTQILFKLSNYFLRFSKEYMRYHRLKQMDNNWYEFVEYGTSNEFRIWLQKCGYSREATYYIEKHKEFYFYKDGNYFLNSEIIESSDMNVRTETQNIMYNRPEIFDIK